MKQTKQLTPHEKQALKKEQERRFTRIAIISVAVILLACIAALGFALLRDIDFERGTPYDKDSIKDSYWYTEDGTICWFFTRVEGGDYIYFFTREGEDDPYITQVYTAYTADGDKGKMDVYLEKDIATTFICTFEDDKLTLRSSEQTLHFVKGVSVAERNKQILGVTGTPYDAAELTGKWFSEDKTKLWVFSENNTLQIFERDSTDESFLLKESLNYAAGGQEGTLSVEHSAGEQTVYACTIRDQRIILVENNRRTILYRESTEQ